jgi:hypothetical protein
MICHVYKLNGSMVNRLQNKFLFYSLFLFIDFLLNHPEIVSKYSHWFHEDIKPVIDDSIYFKQCQLKNMIQKK